MQHILFSVISAIIGINILVVSAQRETNQAPEFEHYDVESVYDVDATPYLYKEATPSNGTERISQLTEEILPLERKAISESTDSPVATISASLTPTMPVSISPIQSPSPTGTLTGSPTPTDSISITPTGIETISISPTPTL
jgi:hypothetical protein